MTARIEVHVLYMWPDPDDPDQEVVGDFHRMSHDTFPCSHDLGEPNYNPLELLIKACKDKFGQDQVPEEHRKRNPDQILYFDDRSVDGNLEIVWTIPRDGLNRPDPWENYPCPHDPNQEQRVWPFLDLLKVQFPAEPEGKRALLIVCFRWRQ